VSRHPRRAATDKTAGGSGGRLAELDVLRAAAVLLVIGHHWAQFVNRDTSALTRVMWRSGWAGVDLFFVLSGFLVSGLLFREYARHGKVNILRFFVRRGFKIYPGFYAMIAVMSFIQYGQGERPAAFWKSLLAEVVFFQNYFRGLWNHTWSLAIEEHFYLLLGLGFVAYTSRWKLGGNLKRASLLVVLVCAACLAGRFLTARELGYTWTRVYSPTHLRIDALLFGVGLSYAYQYQRARVEAFLGRFGLPLLAVSLALVIWPFLLAQEAPLMYTVGLLSLTVGFGGLMMLMVVRGGTFRRRVPWLVAPLAFVGRHSYSIYLWHMPVLWLVGYRLLKSTGWANGGSAHFWAYFGGTLLVGIGAARLIEIPAIALRDRIMPSRSGAVVD
jgi:peptidoglycan/LPS O-acetylase OafA/YrhL